MHGRCQTKDTGTVAYLRGGRGDSYFWPWVLCVCCVVASTEGERACTMVSLATLYWCLLLSRSSHYRHCKHSMWSRVCETVCLSHYQTAVATCREMVCCWVPRRSVRCWVDEYAFYTKGIGAGCSRCRALTGSGVAEQVAAWCSAANASSVTFTADVGGWTQTNVDCMRDAKVCGAGGRQWLQSSQKLCWFEWKNKLTAQYLIDR